MKNKKGSQCCSFLTHSFGQEIGQKKKKETKKGKQELPKSQSMRTYYLWDNLVAKLVKWLPSLAIATMTNLNVWSILLNAVFSL